MKERRLKNPKERNVEDKYQERKRSSYPVRDKDNSIGQQNGSTRRDSRTSEQEERIKRRRARELAERSAEQEKRTAQATDISSEKNVQRENRRKKVSPDKHLEREGRVKRLKQEAPTYGNVEQEDDGVKQRQGYDLGRKGHGQSYRPLVSGNNMDRKRPSKEERRERIAESRTTQHKGRSESEAVKERWKFQREERSSQLAESKERVNSKRWDEDQRRPKREEYERIVRHREEPKLQTREREQSKREGGRRVSQAQLMPRESKNAEKHRPHPKEHRPRPMELSGDDQGELQTL